MKQAEAVAEFAKANGFPNASVYLWDRESETPSTDPDDAVDGWDDGAVGDFDICLALGGVRIRQELRTDNDGMEYSNGVEVSK